MLESPDHLDNKLQNKLEQLLAAQPIQVGGVGCEKSKCAKTENKFEISGTTLIKQPSLHLQTIVTSLTEAPRRFVFIHFLFLFQSLLDII